MFHVSGLPWRLLYQHQETHGHRQEHLRQHHRQTLPLALQQDAGAGRPVRHLGRHGALALGRDGEAVQQLEGDGGGGQGWGQAAWGEGPGCDEILDGA